MKAWLVIALLAVSDICVNAQRYHEDSLIEDHEASLAQTHDDHSYIERGDPYDSLLSVDDRDHDSLLETLHDLDLANSVVGASDEALLRDHEDSLLEGEEALYRDHEDSLLESDEALQRDHEDSLLEEERLGLNDLKIISRKFRDGQLNGFSGRLSGDFQGFAKKLSQLLPKGLTSQGFVAMKLSGKQSSLDPEPQEQQQQRQQQQAPSDQSASSFLETDDWWNPKTWGIFQKKVTPIADHVGVTVRQGGKCAGAADKGEATCCVRVKSKLAIFKTRDVCISVAPTPGTADKPTLTVSLSWGGKALVGKEVTSQGKYELCSTVPLVVDVTGQACLSVDAMLGDKPKFVSRLTVTRNAKKLAAIDMKVITVQMPKPVKPAGDDDDDDDDQ